MLPLTRASRADQGAKDRDVESRRNANAPPSACRCYYRDLRLRGLLGWQGIGSFRVRLGPRICWFAGLNRQILPIGVEKQAVVDVIG